MKFKLLISLSLMILLLIFLCLLAMAQDYSTYYSYYVHRSYESNQGVRWGMDTIPDISGTAKGTGIRIGITLHEEGGHYTDSTASYYYRLYDTY